MLQILTRFKLFILFRRLAVFLGICARFYIIQVSGQMSASQETFPCCPEKTPCSPSPSLFWLNFPYSINHTLK